MGLRVARLCLAGALSAGGAACFIGYDSRWGDATRAQQAAANRSTPQVIRKTGGEGARPAALAHTLRVRFRPTARYLGEVVDAPKQIADMLDDANAVVGPDLGIKLLSDGLEPWSFQDDEHIEAALDALVAEDTGNGASWVVGMLGGIAKQTDSLHLSGYAPILGRHFVVRAAGRLGERDAIEEAFSSLSEDERARVLRARKRHRAVAVFLHELGHSLGALHEGDAESLMNPVYALERTRFGSGAIALMRAALDGADSRAIARAQIALLESKGTPWIPADRDDEIARLRAKVEPPTGASPPAGEPQDEASSADRSALSAEDNERFQRAKSFVQLGAVAMAYEEARPLFSAYPDVYGVQDLRCQLALVRWLEPAQLATECAAMKRLSGGGDAGSAPR